jgi:D-amino-acid dehydrogenase
MGWPARAPSVTRSVLYAFGNGHQGLTQAAATAALVCELAMAQAPSLDLAAFSAVRFGTHQKQNG